MSASDNDTQAENLSWSESEDEQSQKSLKRPADSEPQTPSTKRIKQLQTPPTTGRVQRVVYPELEGSEFARFLKEGEELLQLLDDGSATWSIHGPKLLMYINRQSRLLLAASRSRAAMKKALDHERDRNQLMVDEVSLLQARAATNNAVITSLRNEVSHLRSAMQKSD